MDRLHLGNIGPVKSADLAFGDLTVFVGPQATGKTIAAQCLRLAVDLGYVQNELAQHGIDWGGRLDEFCDAYFGEGMHTIWHGQGSALAWNDNSLDLAGLVARKRKKKDQSLFYIPAQRVLALRDGWPRPFSDFSAGDPFAVREFSEQLRHLVDREPVGAGHLFPQERRLKRDFRELLQSQVFGAFQLQVNKQQSQKRLVLGTNGSPLPFMVWSAGQREFVPLLLGLYWLMPPAKVSRRGTIQWVVLEEPEMGLHPRAISVILLLVFELLARGYRVCLSTHSPYVLEAVWALRHLKSSGAAADDLLDIFDAPKTQPMQKMAQAALQKSIKVFYFDRVSGNASDISDLEPGAEQADVAGWGGLMEFSERANSVVARAIARAERGG